MSPSLNFILLVVFFALAPSLARAVLVNNTAPRTTADGAPVDSHNGGLILAWGGRYLLFGVSFGGCPEQPEGCTNTTAGACGFGWNQTVSVYSSTDLGQDSWALERADVLPVPAGPARGSISRPSLVHCARTGAWLLWWNFGPPGSGEDQWALAVARSASPLGPFELVAAPVALPHAFIGDFTVFVDAGAVAWVYYTTWAERGRLFLARLDAAYEALASPLELHGPLFNNLSLVESPIIWRRPATGLYYLATGRGCCYCAEGSGMYVFTAPAVTGPYTARGNVGCNYSEPAAHVSVLSQGCLADDGVIYTSLLQAELAYSFAVGEGAAETRVLVFDRWQHAPDKLKSHDPEYWLPVEYAPDGGLRELRRVDAWELDAPPPPPPPPPPPAPAPALTPFEPVALGGGGFTSGILVAPPTAAGGPTVYTRTDVGGVYRLRNASGALSWVPLTDAFTFTERNWYGGEALAVSATDAAHVWAALGAYYAAAETEAGQVGAGVFA